MAQLPLHGINEVQQTDTVETAVIQHSAFQGWNGYWKTENL